ncbi:MFS transporter [Pseudonocardia sp. GCM10023141]|uniref:MFS transporter n=1 Tax=Pseudonocardia sp. GCM10023141 TaxID=3252653 RepID=UPI003605C3BC
MTSLRRSRLAVSLVFAACGAAFATWAARIPAAQQQVGLDAGGLAIALFGLALGSVLMLLASGPLLARIGSRTGALIGAVVLCGGLPLVTVAATPTLFIGAVFVLGMGNSLLDVSMNAHAARVEHAYRRPIFAGFHAWWNVGGLAGSGTGALLATYDVPIDVHFPIAGAVLLCTAVWAVTTGFLPGPDIAPDTAFALPGKALIPLGVIAFCGFLAEGTVNDWSAVQLIDVAGATAAVASLGFFAFSATMIAVRLVADRFADRVGLVPFTRTVAATGLAGFALVTALPTPAIGIVGYAVIGVGAAAIVPLAWSSATRRDPGSAARSIAALATCGYLGFLLGPVLVGAAATAFGLQAAIGIAGLGLVVVFLLAPTLRVRVAA